MKPVSIAVESRSETGKGHMRRLRAQGFVPGVLYGKGKTTQPVKVSAIGLQEYLRKAGRTTLLKLESSDQTVNGRHALVRELQTNVLNDKPVHVDLYGVELDQPIFVNVQLEYVGIANGEKAGGVRNISTYKLGIIVRADSIPEKIQVDVTNVEIGKALHAGDVKLPQGAKLKTDPTIGLFMVEVAKKEEVATAGASIEGAAPAAAASDAKAAPAADVKAAAPVGDAKATAKPTTPAAKGKK